MVAPSCHLGIHVKRLDRLFAAVLFVAGIVSAVDAVASPLSEALARHSERDVQQLRGRPDLAARCTLGAVYAQRRDLSRAALYLAGCDDAELPADIAGGVARIQRDLKKQLDASDLAMIEVVSTPAGLTATVSALPAEPFTTPATLYLPAGDHEVSASFGGSLLKNVIHAAKRSRGVVVLDAGIKTIEIKQPKTTQIDMSENGGAVDEKHDGPPPAVAHGNMMAEKYQKGMKAVAAVEPNPNALEDPFAIRQAPRAPRAYWLGLRVGGGMFDDSAARARAGLAVAATGRFALAHPVFLAARIDWSRRGGEGAIDVVGASAGAGLAIADRPAVAVAVLAQLRGELRLASERTMATTDVDVRRAGVAAALGLELSLPRSPFSAGLRFEQGLTTLVPGARDRAMLIELGVDWR